MEHSEHNFGGWRWQILGAIRAVATAGEPGEVLIICPVSNAWFYQFPVGQFHEIWTQHVYRCRDKNIL